MAQSHRRLVPSEDVRAARHGKYKLDELDPTRIAKHLTMFQPTEQGVADILAKARLSIPGIAETEEVLRVVRYNPICIMALARKSKFDSLAPEAEGFVAVLPLNKLGLQNLALGAFNATSPDLRLVAKPDEQQPPGLVADPHGHRRDLARLAGSVAGGEHVRRRAAQIGIKSRRCRALDRDRDVRTVVGLAGHRGEMGSQRNASGRGDRGQPDIDRQGSTSGGL